jgi:NAD(P)-dependent dehydrogenase (short-subunit alcohol dehydrogenase family)
LLQSAYTASKAALINLTKAIATQYGRDGIRANLVLPGFTESKDSTRQGAAKHADELLKRNLIPRLGQPEDIANAALFLASEEASFITGQLLSVEGGGSVHAGHLAFDGK